ncbi:hypothetical protein V3C40_27660 [Janthinobacterium sp. LS2A]|uniref:hypothetical protein n=1 Tax=Janthinobacterium sp. LS2A TaxID=3118590 RepID=UPI002F93F695
MRELAVLVGQGLDAELLQQVLQENRGKRLNEVAHALLDDHPDDRAEIYEVKVDRVAIDEDCPTQVDIEFEIFWRIYRGCEDRNTVGSEYQQERATYEADGRLVFLAPLARKHSDPC